MSLKNTLRCQLVPTKKIFNKTYLGTYNSVQPIGEEFC